MAAQYVGIVRDLLAKHHNIVSQTRRNPTWESAHRAAERLAKRKGLSGNRYAIDVDIEG